MALYLLAVSLHLLAAVTWIGGMVFLSMVLMPALRSEHVITEQDGLFRIAARRFRIVVWLAILVLLATGPVLLHTRNVSLLSPHDWPVIVQMKIALVVLLLFLTVAHELLSGQHVTRLRGMPEIAGTALGNLLIKTSRWIPRLALMVGILVLLAAVVLTRS